MLRVIGSPRLAIVGRPVAIDAALFALQRIFEAWQIPIVLFGESAPEEPVAPWAPLMPHSMQELASLAADGLRVERDRSIVRTGGELTLLVDRGDPARTVGAALETDTPILLALEVSDLTGEQAIDAGLLGELGVLEHAQAALAGALLIEDRDARAEHNGSPLGLGTRSTGESGETVAAPSDAGRLSQLAWLGSLPPIREGEVAQVEPDHPIAELDLADTRAADELSRRVNLNALLRIANRAPLLLAEQPGPAKHAASRSHGASLRGKAISVLGTHSSAGKSFVVSALARYLSDQGLRVAPFKGQNMSNNARVAKGGEIGVAQYMQARAARVQPDVRMNPVLLKPHARDSHVILMGRPEPEITALPWRLRKPILWPAVRQALHELLDEYDVVLIEGAGSPTEPFLYHNDIVNMRIAREAGAAAMIVSDAGQGGAVAQSYGTWKMLASEDRALVRGFLFNRFYKGGYTDMFLPGCAQLEQMTGVPSLGILPMLDVDLPEEDLHSLTGARGAGARRVAIVTAPRISNFDEFAALERIDDVAVVWATSVEDLAGADLVILPGSKNVPADLQWMRERGLDQAVADHVERGQRLLGICGGLQMLGVRLEDPDGAEGEADGLGLLPLLTTYRAEKVQDNVTVTFSAAPEAWSALNDLTLSGYQIRHGRTSLLDSGGDGVATVLPDGMGFAQGSVLAVSMHGLFEDAALLRAVFGVEADPQQAIEDSFDALSAALNEHLDMDRLQRILTV